MMQVALRFINSLSLMFWIGSIFFFSLFVASSIFKVLPRELAGDLVSDIFPKYYNVAYICGSLFLLSLLTLILRGNESFSRGNNLKLLLAGAMLVLSFYSGAVLSEQISGVKSEIRQVKQGTEQHQGLESRFKSLHAISAVINMVVFVFGIAIVFINNYTYCLNETNSFGR